MISFDTPPSHLILLLARLILPPDLLATRLPTNSSIVWDSGFACVSGAALIFSLSGLFVKLLHGHIPGELPRWMSISAALLVVRVIRAW